MKKRVISILLALMVICLAGCGGQGDAEAAFDTMMTTLQSGDMDEISAYYDFRQVSKFANSDDENGMIQVVLSTLKKLDYQITDVEKLDDNTVKMTADVTMLNFTNVINSYVEQLILMVEDDAYQAQVANLEQEEYQKMVAERMIELLENEEIETEEKTVSVTMIKQEDGTWVPGPDKDEFFGGLFVNLFDAVNSLL